MRTILALLLALGLLSAVTVSSLGCKQRSARNKDHVHFKDDGHDHKDDDLKDAPARDASAKDADKSKEKTGHFKDDGHNH